jgi:hypothetical protein
MQDKRKQYNDKPIVHQTSSTRATHFAHERLHQMPNGHAHRKLQWILPETMMLCQAERSSVPSRTFIKS